LWNVLSLPFGLLLGENHVKLFRFPRMRGIPGIFIRQLVNITSLFLICAFSSMLKAALVNPTQPKLLKFNYEVMSANKPVLLFFIDRLEYKLLLQSNSVLDNWLYDNVHAVFFFNE